jgi:hypothetical protein
LEIILQHRPSGDSWKIGEIEGYDNGKIWELVENCGKIPKEAGFERAIVETTRQRVWVAYQQGHINVNDDVSIKMPKPLPPSA